MPSLLLCTQSGSETGVLLPLQRRKRVKLSVHPAFWGTDLAKQIRDVKDASNIGQKIGSGHKIDAQRRQPSYRHSYPDKKRHKGYGNNIYKQPFFRERSENDRFPATKVPSRQEITKSLEEIEQSVSNLSLFVHDLKLYLGDRCDHFRAGCMVHSIANWKNITSDTEILSAARGATIWIWCPSTCTKT